MAKKNRRRKGLAAYDWVSWLTDRDAQVLLVHLMATIEEGDDLMVLRPMIKGWRCEIAHRPDHVAIGQGTTHNAALCRAVLALAQTHEERPMDTTLQGTYNNWPVILHQRDGHTVRMTPGRFCPACQDTRSERTDDGDRQCRACQRVYYVPTQGDIDQALGPPPEDA